MGIQPPGHESRIYIRYFLLPGPHLTHKFMLHKDGLSILDIGPVPLTSIGCLFIDLEEGIEKGLYFILIGKKIFSGLPFIVLVLPFITLSL